MDNPIFIVGLPRSGSTLWLSIITKHPDVFRIGEMLCLTPWRKDFRYFCRKIVGNLSKRDNIKNMINLIFSKESIPGITASFWRYYTESFNDQNLKEKIYRKILDSDKSLRSIFKTLIEEITKFHGLNRCCVKFPVYVNYVPNLLQWYPNCKIIHIIRDPRALAISKTNDPGGTKIKINKYPNMSFVIRKMMIFFVVFQYIWTSRLHRKYKKINNYALFRYEDLLDDPERIIRELCDFIELDFVPEMLQPKKGQASSVTGRKSSSFDKKAATRWKYLISPFEEKMINLLTKKSMKRFEYNPENHQVYFDD